ncbi:phosphoribosylglycinamide formyltransferase [Nocardiopsis kunsanensis]|uniref:Phosphoribosylglycinamide formyltransferase n=1 Tax=Nocardiopsis kunsanensis TaxID=141693 RepID=A0A918X9A8_9ACTN|nr:phosphoribosylglycinamide formyltransferase [Nocardiopsis kunsanensis]
MLFFYTRGRSTLSARVVVLISGTGSNMSALLDACRAPEYGAQVVAVGSDRPGAGGLERAEADGVPTFVVPFRDYTDRSEWDTAMSDRIAAFEPDLVVSAGFMRILGPAVVGRHAAINIHPALLPSFPGAHAVREALAHGVRITGTTIHFLDEGVDSGPIIDQATVPVEDGDDEAALHERIKIVERRMLVDTVGELARRGWNVDGRHVRLGRTEQGRTNASETKETP